jgi:drug/metabolite transporter (DMT)-like permease
MESYAIENDYDAYMEGTAGLSVSDWYFGIGLSVLASIFGASSKLAIRKSWLIQKRYEIELDGFQINKNENRSSVELASNTETLLPERYRDRIWRAYLLRCWGMFGMSIMNPICSVLAMNFASPSILAPFSGLTLVWVIVFSGVAVGENPSTSEIGAASLIVMGEVIVAIFGDHTNDKHTTVDEVVSKN